MHNSQLFFIFAKIINSSTKNVCYEKVLAIVAIRGIFDGLPVE
jgi:hypothetical protein